MLKTLKLTIIPVYNRRRGRRYNLRQLAAIAGIVAYNTLMLAILAINALLHIAMTGLAAVIATCIRLIDSLVHPPRKGKGE